MLDYIHVNTGLTTGGAGVSTATETSEAKIRGKLLGFYVQYNGAPPATTDLVIATVGSVLPDRTILTLTNINTSGYYAVESGVVSAAGAAITDSHSPIPLIDDAIKATISQADDNDSADVWAVVER